MRGLLGSAKRQAEELEASLRAMGKPERAPLEKKYLKSALCHYGVGVPGVRLVAKNFFRDNGALGHDDLVSLVNDLWSKPVHELRLLGVELLDAYFKLLRPGDLALIEKLIRASRTWALVDPLAVNIAGRLLHEGKSPESKTLELWVGDGDFWLRRAALLTFLRPLREGGGDFDRFGRYADALLEDKEFFIRKAIGWVLRDTSRKRPELVRAWLEPRAFRASGVTLREARKYLS